MSTDLTIKKLLTILYLAKLSEKILQFKIQLLYELILV
jgi:hypothetical protein